MSTSDAGESELRVVGGEAERVARNSTTRAQQDDIFDERFQQENHHGGEHHLSAITRKGAQRALIIEADTTRQEAAGCVGSEVQIQKPSGPRFTSSLFITLSKYLRLNKAELQRKPLPDSCIHSLSEPQRAETEGSCCQISRQTSPPDTPTETTSDCLLPEIIPCPATREEEHLTVGCNDLLAGGDLSVTDNLSNGDFGLHEHNGLFLLWCGAQPKRSGSGSVQLEEDIRQHTKLGNLKDLGELSNTAVTMLSSAMVMVLAPNWSGRQRRNKKFEGTVNSATQGNFQDMMNTAADCAHECFQETQNQHGVERVLTDGSQTQLRVPFPCARRNTVDWSTKSGPARIDLEWNRKMIHTVSMNNSSGRMDNRNRDVDPLSHVAPTASPLPPLSLDPNEQRRNPQTNHQGALSSLSSKPTTSFLLMSLRRNSSGRSSNAASILTEENPMPSDHEANLLTTHLHKIFLNNDQERSKSFLSPSSNSYRVTKTGPILSPSPSNHRPRDICESRFFSTSPVNEDTEDTPCTQQPQTCSKQAFLSRQTSAREQNYGSSNRNTNLFPESSVSSPRHSPYSPTVLQKKPSLPRRTTLTSTSWWKQVTPKGSSPYNPSDKTNIRDQLSTPLVPSCSDNNDLVSPGPTDNKRFSCQILSNRDNNNTAELVCKGNMNLVMKTQGGTQELKKRNAEDSPDHKSDRLIQQQYGCISNNRESQKPHNLSNDLSRDKISDATAQSTLSSRKDLSKHYVCTSSHSSNVTELPPTLLNLTSPLNKDSEMFTKQSYSPATNATLNSQAYPTYGLPPTPKTKSLSYFHSHQVSSQTSTHTSLHAGSSAKTSKLDKTANATPLGFERSYASIPKNVHSKILSSLIPTASAFSKTNQSPVSPSIISCTTGRHPAASTSPGQSLPTSPATPHSSILTPPATPVTTSSNYPETSSPKEERTFSSSPEKDPKKLAPRENGKRARRVTWEDSRNLQHSEPITVDKPDLHGVETCPLSPSRSPRSVRAPSIFSFLRSSDPTTNTSSSPLCSPTPKTSSIQVGKGAMYQSHSTDSADVTSGEQEGSQQRPSDTMIFDQEKLDTTTLKQERTLSLSLPPDFTSGYKLRYSSPPYSTLMSSRSTLGETKTITPPFQQVSRSPCAPHPSLNTESGAAVNITASKLPLLPNSPPQTSSFPFQNKTARQENSKRDVSETDVVNNNYTKNSNQDHQNGQILLVDNRVHVSSQCLQGNKAKKSTSTCVTETLVYSIQSKIDTVTAGPKITTPKPLQHNANRVVTLETKLSQQTCTVQSKEASGKPPCHSDHSSSGGSTAESQSQEDEGCNRTTKESMLGRSRFFSVESSNEQSPKKSRFALKKSVSATNASLTRSDSERANKTNSKMEEVLNRLRQTFSTRWSDDELSFPWKWKRASQTSSVSGSSDISNVNDITAKSTKMLNEQEQEEVGVLKENEKGTEGTNRWTQNTIIQAVGSTATEDQFSICLDKSTPETYQDQDKQHAYVGHKSESKSQVHLTVQSPATYQFDFYKDNRTEYKLPNQFPSCTDPSHGRSPNPSGGYPAQLSRSTSSPRSPFSPFSSLCPFSSFSSSDVTDDSVFYSPKLQRHRESSSPCEPEEGISLGGSRRSRASTGPPSAGPGQDKEHLASSYADLKYGIEPGRSFSVSSVLSSRPSGPGRISTGSRFMSVGDLPQSFLACERTGKNFDQWSFTPNCIMECDCQIPYDCSVYFPGDLGKMRSRSLPRSLTRRLANWSSGVHNSLPVTTIASNAAHLWSPSMDTCQFRWDAEAPPTPPPTPPLSPVSRRMSQPSSLSSPTFPSSSGHLPSRGYVSSLSTFEESSDSNSDTTTDDEYYLETCECEDKETEL